MSACLRLLKIDIAYIVFAEDIFWIYLTKTRNNFFSSTQYIEVCLLQFGRSMNFWIISGLVESCFKRQRQLSIFCRIWSYACIRNVTSPTLVPTKPYALLHAYKKIQKHNDVQCLLSYHVQCVLLASLEILWINCLIIILSVLLLWNQKDRRKAVVYNFRCGKTGTK